MTACTLGRVAFSQQHIICRLASSYDVALQLSNTKRISNVICIINAAMKR